MMPIDYDPKTFKEMQDRFLADHRKTKKSKPKKKDGYYPKPMSLNLSKENIRANQLGIGRRQYGSKISY